MGQSLGMLNYPVTPTYLCLISLWVGSVSSLHLSVKCSA